jgi:hypothetical protein
MQKVSRVRCLEINGRFVQTGLRKVIGDNLRLDLRLVCKLISHGFTDISMQPLRVRL